MRFKQNESKVQEKDAPQLEEVIRRCILFGNSKESLEEWTLIEKKGQSAVQPVDTLNVDKTKLFQQFLSDPDEGMKNIEKLSWFGIPDSVRPLCWKLLLGYISKDDVEEVLEKRRDYHLLAKNCYSDLSKHEKLFSEVSVDIPRLLPRKVNLKLLKDPKVLKIIERVLVVWSVEHPSVGYIQGLGDLVSYFVLLFFSEYFDIEKFNDPRELKEEILEKVEGDSYYCFEKLMNNIEEHLQTLNEGLGGILSRLKSIIKLVDVELHDHLEKESVSYEMFGCRWILLLLSRELDYKLVFRLWDNFLVAGSTLSTFQIYVFAAFLLRWKEELKKKDFVQILTFLQNPPTASWDERDVQLLVKKALEVELHELGAFVMAGVAAKSVTVLAKALPEASTNKEEL